MGEYIASLNHQQVVFLGVSPQDKAVGIDRYEVILPLGEIIDF